MAKNILTVGAADTFGNVSYLSSRGPAYDGRIKPELVAFGEDGSSGAAAHTSGAVLLLQQYYKENNNGTLPAASLIKALLVNNADDRGTKGPDFLSGYGSLNAYNALRGLVNGQYFSGTVAQGATQTFTLTVPANTRQLKLTLSYTDAAAIANAPKALINDLDIELVNNGNGQLWLPWVLSPAPIIDSLLKPAVRKKDTLNNTEQITLDNPPAGTYTIRVKGYAIPLGSQPFFVAWQAQAADQFQWQFPVSVDYIKGGEANLVRWTSTFSNTTGMLEYSIDKGASWQAAGNATLATGNVYWQAPEIYNTALLRMTINGQTFISDTFTISTPQHVQVGFNCADSALLFWSKLPGINSYTVYQLGEKYLQPLVTSADTSIIIRSPGDKLWYTVAPVINNNYQGMKAYTINFRTQGVDCYLKSFYADLQNGNTGWLSASIGTLLNVKSVTFEKLINRQWQPLQTIQPVTRLNFEQDDNNLTDGVNTYRLKIGLNNGLFITSDPQSIYYFLTTRYIIFPNPVRTTSTLTVLMKEEPQNTHLLLFSTLGQKVLQQRLTQTAESIPLGKLKAGIYFVIIQKNGKKEFTGRVMVQ
jgi:hypothetical protein